MSRVFIPLTRLTAPQPDRSVEELEELVLWRLYATPGGVDNLLYGIE